MKSKYRKQSLIRNLNKIMKEMGSKYPVGTEIAKTAFKQAIIETIFTTSDGEINNYVLALNTFGYIESVSGMMPRGPRQTQVYRILKLHN